MDIYQLFPSPLFVRDFSSDNHLDVLSKIKHLHKDFTNSDRKNVETVYTENSSESLLNNKNFLNIISEIEIISKNIFSQIYHYKDVTPYVSDIWSTCLKSGEQGQIHYHSNSYLSGVWYPFDDNYSEICFYSPNNEKNSLNLVANVEDFNQLNCTSYVFHPKKDNLIFFPSYLSHQVLVNKNKNPRYSLAFNIFVKGNLYAHTSRITNL